MRCRWTGALLVALSVVACAGDSPTAPTGPTDDSTNVVTITASGVSPRKIQIRVGERVLFINNDSVVHEMSSDLHPSHLACPVINLVGSISPGQSTETGNFARCRPARIMTTSTRRTPACSAASSSWSKP